MLPMGADENVRQTPRNFPANGSGISWQPRRHRSAEITLRLNSLRGHRSRLGVAVAKISCNSGMAFSSMFHRGAMMKSLRILPAFVFLMSYMLASSASAHGHCDIKTWGPLTSSAALPSPPYSVAAGKDAFDIFFQPMLNDPPPPGSNLCRYEVSDVTQVSVVLTFTGIIDVSIVYFGGMASGVTIAPQAPISFISGVTQTFQLEPHGGTDPATPGPSDQSMPSNLYAVTLEGFDVRSGFTITSASISLSGHHYYLPVPEPDSHALAVAGLFVVGAAARRRSSTQAASSKLPPLRVQA